MKNSDIVDRFVNTGYMYNTLNKIATASSIKNKKKTDRPSS